MQVTAFKSARAPIIHKDVEPHYITLAVSMLTGSMSPRNKSTVPIGISYTVFKKLFGSNT